MNLRFSRGLAVSSSIAGIVAGLFPGTAGADAKVPEVTVDLDVYPSTSFARAASDRSKSDLLPTEAEDFVQVFLDEQASQGRLVDAANVSELSSGPITVVLENGVALNDVRVRTTSIDGSVYRTELGSSVSESGDLSPTASTNAGLGMNALIDWKNGDLRGSGCATIHHPQVSGHRFTTCYEKWKAADTDANRDMWLYNRWGTATARGDGILHIYAITEFTLRTRPWNGTRNRLRTMRNYWPHSGSSLCTNDGEVTVTAGPFEATMPWESCRQTEILEDASKIRMGIKWRGYEKTQLSTDYAFAVDSWPGQTALFADYQYASFEDTQVYCGITSCTTEDELYDWDSGFPE